MASANASVGKHGLLIATDEYSDQVNVQQRETAPPQAIEFYVPGLQTNLLALPHDIAQIDLTGDIYLTKTRNSIAVKCGFLHKLPHPPLP
ncbi:MAG: hypothetical protein CL912_25590 [Deltaproteobacteria bacterium]|nr:hypothetical protein [Deltaproteobacteria bacterium]